MTKTFDAVAESRKWRAATSLKLDAMTLEERLAYLNRSREEYLAARNAEAAVKSSDDSPKQKT